MMHLRQFFLIFLATSYLYGSDTAFSHIDRDQEIEIRNQLLLENTPDWFSLDLLSSTHQHIRSSPFSHSDSCSYQILSTCNEKTGLPERITLVQNDPYEEKGVIICNWDSQTRKLVQFSIQQENESSASVTHHFLYNSSKNLSGHTIRGCLRGIKGKEDSYTTEIECKPGITILKYPNGLEIQTHITRSDDITTTVCLIQTGDGLVRRKVSSEWETADSLMYEEIEDDAISSEAPFSFRNWSKKTFQNNAEGNREILEIGAYDPTTKEKQLRRKIVTLFDSYGKVKSSTLFDIDETQQFRAIGAHLTIGKHQLLSPNQDSSYDDNPDIKLDALFTVDGLGRIQNRSENSDSKSYHRKFSYDLFGNLSSQKTIYESENGIKNSSIKARYTSRRTIAAKEYEDGSQEVYRYDLSGMLISHMLKDGTCIHYTRDGLGRIIRGTRKRAGVEIPEDFSYTYSGEYISHIQDTEFGNTNIYRDIFGRIILQEQESREGVIEKQAVIYNSLDLPIRIEKTESSNLSTLEFTYTPSGKIQRLIQTKGIGTQRSTHQTFELIYSPEEKLSSITKKKSDEQISISISFDEKGRELLRSIEASDDRFPTYYEKTSYEANETHLIKTMRSDLGFIKKEKYSLQSHKKESESIEKIDPSSHHSQELMSRKSEWEWKDIYGSCKLRETFRLKSGEEIQKEYEWLFNNGRKLAEVRSSEGEKESYLYDKHGRVVTLQRSDGISIQYIRNSLGQVVELLSSDNSIQYHYKYNSQGLIIEAYDAISDRKVVREFSEKGELISDGEEEKPLFVEYNTSSPRSSQEPRSISKIRLPNRSEISYYPDSNDAFLIEKRSNSISSPIEWSISCKNPYNLQNTRPLFIADKGAFFQSIDREDRTVGIDPFGSISQEKKAGNFDYSISFLPTGDVLGYSEKNSHEEIIILDKDGRTKERGDHHFSYNASGNLSRYTISSETIDKDIEYRYDALHRLSHVIDHLHHLQEIYRYDALHRIQTVECRSLEENIILSQQEKIWFGFQEIGLIIKDYQKGTTDHFLKIPHPISLSHTLIIESHGIPYQVEQDSSYTITTLIDRDGNRVESKEIDLFGHEADSTDHSYSPWTFRGKQKIGFSTLYDFGLRRYMPQLFHWLEKDPMGTADGIHYRSFLSNCPFHSHDPNGLFSLGSLLGNRSIRLKDGLGYISSQLQRSLQFAIKSYDQFSEFNSLLEDMMLQTIGKTWMTMIGYNPTLSHTGCVGNMSYTRNNVRITHINGVLNASKDQIDNAALVSLLHGNYPVHYVYSATNGFTGDLVRCAISKTGITSKAAKLLGNLWKSLIEEMGGVDSGGIIIHYAHSLGGTDTASALKFLTEEEQSVIRIITFGSATLLRKGYCHSIENYISLKDGIPMIADPLSYWSQRVFEHRDDIYFLESESYPFVDHLFTNTTYRAILEEIGIKFQEEFIQQKIQESSDNDRL